MKSNQIKVSSRDTGLEQVVMETGKVAQYCELSPKDAMHACLIAEEMVSMIGSVAGNVDATFQIETEGKEWTYSLTSYILLDETKRSELIAAASSRKNAAAKGVLGKIRDAFEKAMVASANNQPDTLLMYDMDPDEYTNRMILDLPQIPGEESEDWDRYERSILLKVADNVKVGIRGNKVELTITKKFA